MKKSVCFLLSAITVLSIFLLAFSACSSSKEDKIVGKWKGPSGSFLELKDDGTAIFPYRGMVVEGKFEVNQKNKLLSLTGTLGGISVKNDYEYSLADNELTLRELTEESKKRPDIYIRVTEDITAK